MDELKGYPKYQYSVFLKSGRDEQLVIRADDFDEFMALKANINKILDKVQPAVTVAPTTPVTQTTTSNQGINCMTCGAPATQRQGVSKAGKSYNGIFCSTENKSHTKWL